MVKSEALLGRQVGRDLMWIQMMEAADANRPSYSCICQSSNVLRTTVAPVVHRCWT